MPESRCACRVHIKHLSDATEYSVIRCQHCRRCERITALAERLAEALDDITADDTAHPPTIAGKPYRSLLAEFREAKEGK